MTPDLHTEVNRPAIPTGGTTITASVEVEPGEQLAPVQRHVALCIDTSGSMSGDKIDRARDGASWVFGLLDDDDYVTIVAFDSDAELVLRPTRWGDIDREAAMERVTELGAGGSTHMFEGLKTASNALESLQHRDRATEGRPVKRILLLSDGKDKQNDPPEFRDLAVDIDESGIRVEAGGIGDEYNEETIRTLGTTARGTWTHLERPGDIEEFFGDAVEQANAVVAADARLELDVGPGVEVSDVYRALPQAQAVDIDWEDNTAIVKLPDLTERERQRVVMKVHAPPGEANSTADLVEVALTARGGTAHGTINVDYTDDNARLAEHNEGVQLDHQETVIRTELGRGNVDAAETQVEKMTEIHGEETQVVQDVQRETQVVKEGDRADRNRATKVLDDDDRLGE